MKRRGGKKGLSPVVATALLVMLVLVLASIVFMWARGFVQEQVSKNGASSSEVCSQVSFEAAVEPVAGNDKKYTISIVNTGNYPIHSFDVKVINGSSKKVYIFDFAVNPSETIPGELIEFDKVPEKLIIYPKILGVVEKGKVNRESTCINKDQTITL